MEKILRLVKFLSETSSSFDVISSRDHSAILSSATRQILAVGTILGSLCFAGDASAAPDLYRDTPVRSGEETPVADSQENTAPAATSNDEGPNGVDQEANESQEKIRKKLEKVGQGPHVSDTEPMAKPPTISQFRFVPMPFSNPSLGTGLALVGLYQLGDRFHPSTFAATAGYTSNKSRIAGAGGNIHLANDRVRLAAMLGKAKLNLKYYGVGPDSIFSNNPVKFSGIGEALQVKAEYRIAKSTFVGLTGRYIDAKIVTKLPIDALPDLKVPFKIHSFGPLLEYDSRDNASWPTGGVHLVAKYQKYHDTNKFFGKKLSRNFEIFDLTASAYTKISDRVIVAGQIFVSEADKNTAFFLKPSLTLRGYPSGSVLNNAAVQAQTEIRFMLSKKFGVVGFGGLGVTGTSMGHLNYLSGAGGAGIRYRISQASGINIGLDAAYGGNDVAVYFRIGEAF